MTKYEFGPTKIINDPDSPVEVRGVLSDAKADALELMRASQQHARMYIVVEDGGFTAPAEPADPPTVEFDTTADIAEGLSYDEARQREVDALKSRLRDREAAYIAIDHAARYIDFLAYNLGGNRRHVDRIHNLKVFEAAEWNDIEKIQAEAELILQYCQQYKDSYDVEPTIEDRFKARS